MFGLMPLFGEREIPDPGCGDGQRISQHPGSRHRRDHQHQRNESAHVCEAAASLGSRGSRHRAFAKFMKTDNYSPLRVV